MAGVRLLKEAALTTRTPHDVRNARACTTTSSNSARAVSSKLAPARSAAPPGGRGVRRCPRGGVLRPAGPRPADVRGHQVDVRVVTLLVRPPAPPPCPCRRTVERPGQVAGLGAGARDIEAADQERVAQRRAISTESSLSATDLDGSRGRSRHGDRRLDRRVAAGAELMSAGEQIVDGVLRHRPVHRARRCRCRAGHCGIRRA